MTCSRLFDEPAGEFGIVNHGAIGVETALRPSRAYRLWTTSVV